MQIEHSHRDPDHLCPVPAGPALLDGKRLTVRLEQGDASIVAPRSVRPYDDTRLLGETALRLIEFRLSLL